MFRKKHRNIAAPSVPAGISELILCVVDEKRKVRYRFQGGDPEGHSGDLFRILEASPRSVENAFLTDAFKARASVSFSLVFGEGQQKHVHVLPYEHKRGRLLFACMQVTTARPDPDIAGDASQCALSAERICFLITDAEGRIRSVSSRIPESFGYAAENLAGRPLNELFNAAAAAALQAAAADTAETIMRTTLFCLDGARRDVELRKFSLPEEHTLYGLCDVSPRQRGDDLGEVTARERMRIGQDLHDSIGQTLTGISLLSRSLANGLERDGHAGSEDASQVSELADEASNQIRQISRGLLPSEVVQQGLFASLMELARATTNSCGIECAVRLDESIRLADVAVETHLYRIAQEAVNNAVRHAAATRIDLVVSEVDGQPQLDVIDNGRWIEPEADVVGIGLKTMEYRASAVGGRFNIGTSPQGGTQVTCRLESDDALATRI